jgi:hypothetical protein
VLGFFCIFVGLRGSLETLNNFSFEQDADFRRQFCSIESIENKEEVVQDSESWTTMTRKTRNGMQIKSLTERKFKTCYDLVMASFSTANPDFTGLYTFELFRTKRLSVFCDADDRGCPNDLPSTCDSMESSAGQVNGTCGCRLSANIWDCDCGEGEDDMDETYTYIESDREEINGTIMEYGSPIPRPGDSLPCWLPIGHVSDLGVYQCENSDCVKVQDPALERHAKETSTRIHVAKDFLLLACFGVVTVIFGRSLVAKAPAWYWNARRPSRIAVGPPWLCVCGFSNQPGTHFCGVCAALKPEAQERLERWWWSCSSCGSRNPRDAQFCVGCGSPQQSEAWSCVCETQCHTKFCTTCGRGRDLASGAVPCMACGMTNAPECTFCVGCGLRLLP